MKVSQRGQVPPFYAMRVFEAALARRDAGLPVYMLNAGQPGTPAPSTVRAAAHQALDANRIGYTSQLGIPELRDAIAGHYRRWYDLDILRNDVVATTGSSGGFLLAFLAAFEPGDVVALARPGYPAYRNVLTALGCRVVELPCGPETRFQPTVAALDALPERPAGLVVASPANPTGTMVTADELAGLAAWCDANDVRLISDEIYHGITYSGSPACAWATSRNAIVVNSFSKYFSMTGWRLGWLLCPPELLDSVDRLASNFALCPPTLAQYAAVSAFDAYDELDANVARYRANRELLLERLPKIGLDRLAPADGAFYIYADVSRWTSDSLALGARLLTETGVAVAPGIDFDTVDGGKFIRMSFAGDTDEIAAAVDILGDWLAAHER
ncbi:MAG TPA: pyridoxal phosphate-dependent aminotransferase [Jatrophihabitantaceae bacterium]